MHDTDIFIGTFGFVCQWSRWFLCSDLFAVFSIHWCKFYRCTGEVVGVPELTVWFFGWIIIKAIILNYKN